MDHIPAELLHQIFIKLDLKYKLECMLVCRFWYNTLDRRSLLDTLIINSDVFFELEEMIERQPYRATQVEILMLSADFDKRILCNMFPNLREFVAFNSFAPEKTNYLDSPFQFTHATSKLEKIVDSGECELTRQLAMTNMCTSLKSLELFFSELPGLISSDILSQLKNLSVLETLRLRHFRLKLMDLEMVHCNIPSVKDLCLSHTYIISGGVPNGVIPAMLIINLNLELISSDDTHTHTLNSTSTWPRNTPQLLNLFLTISYYNVKTATMLEISTTKALFRVIKRLELKSTLSHSIITVMGWMRLESLMILESS
jgi:hypothetical protein